MSNRNIAAAALEAYERSCNSDPAGAYRTEQQSDAALMAEINHQRAVRNLPPLSLPSEVSANVNERKHSHYFKDVSKYNEADVYRVCQMFDINDPSGATQHAIKKLLLSGGRGGGKDRCKDLQEAIDTMSRLLEMMREDAA